MELLPFSHNTPLVIASLFVALIAGFTGFSLTKGLSEHSIPQRKILITLASIALGGGIWSMHFVAMLGLQLPILFYYDAALTLASALMAILVVGVALLILHFWERTTLTLILAGMIVGLGIVGMHYIGMSAMELCRALNSPLGIAESIAASCILSVCAFSIAYGKRTQRNIILGTLFFGFSVFCVHFVAIAGTDFVATDTVNAVGPQINNAQLAIGVVLSSFVLCGAFLLTGVTFLTPQETPPIPTPAPVEDTQTDNEPAQTTLKQIPYVHEGRTLFLDPNSVAAIRAEGHYTYIYTSASKHFCAWSMTEAEKHLASGPFIKTHRSYMINPSHVTGFERLKDNGVCHFEIASLTTVPVSRSQLRKVRDALGV